MDELKIKFEDMEDYVTCINYDRSDCPAIEKMKFRSGEKWERDARFNVMVFLLSGKMSYTFSGYPEMLSGLGFFLFVPFGAKLQCQVLEDCEILVIRLHKMVRLCESFGIEQLYVGDVNRYVSRKKSPSLLKVNKILKHYIEGLDFFIDYGFRCKYYFDIKLKELFVILKIYYTKEELRDFFRLIMSIDTAFIIGLSPPS